MAVWKWRPKYPNGHESAKCHSIWMFYTLNNKYFSRSFQRRMICLNRIIGFEINFFGRHFHTAMYFLIIVLKFKLSYLPKKLLKLPNSFLMQPTQKNIHFKKQLVQHNLRNNKKKYTRLFKEFWRQSEFVFAVRKVIRILGARPVNKSSVYYSTITPPVLWNYDISNYFSTVSMLMTYVSFHQTDLSVSTNKQAKLISTAYFLQH